MKVTHSPKDTDLVSSRLIKQAEAVLEENEDLDKELARSIRFPKRLWKALDADAERCGRSSVKQMEQLLRIYYSLPHAEVDKARLRAVDLAPKGLSVFVPEDTHAPLARVVNEVADVRPATPEEEAMAHPEQGEGKRKRRR